MSKIEAINKESVHRICSGQVVLNLATAVKELVENSLDAGASIVEVKLKDYGSELVEVMDNGSGVHPDNYEGLTLKHHTSKLREFNDLSSVETFGFRGEALSSLCALSRVSIITRHKDFSVGHRLEFDHHGHIKAKVPVSRQIGTTVTLQDLFSTLPVRQKEFHRHLKKEFAKMTQVLYGYCLVALGVKLSCVNISKQGSRTNLVSTTGSAALRENISCIFGPKQLQNIISITQAAPDADLLEEFKIPANTANIFSLSGFISSAMHGHGRSSTDRQFYFVNSRPCEPSKILKLVNEMYHQFNSNQYPFVVLNIEMARECVDVNVTPDKRQIFMDHEKLLLATVKATLLKLYEAAPRTIPVNALPSLEASLSSTNSTSSSPSPISRISLSMLDKWRHAGDKRKSSSICDDQGKQKQIKLMESFFSPRTAKSTTADLNEDIKTLDETIRDSNEDFKRKNDNEQIESVLSDNHMPKLTELLDSDEKGPILQNGSISSCTKSSEDVIHMSFDSDEEDESFVSKEKISHKHTDDLTNVVDREQDSGFSEVSSQDSVCENLKNRKPEIQTRHDRLNETVAKANSSSDSNVIGSRTNAEGDHYDRLFVGSNQDKSIENDCLHSESDSSLFESPKNALLSSKSLAAVSTRTVEFHKSKFGCSRSVKIDANSSTKSGFLGRLVQFRYDSKNINDINKPKVLQPCNLKVKSPQGRVLNRFRKNDMNHLPEENSRVNKTDDVSSDAFKKTQKYEVNKYEDTLVKNNESNEGVLKESPSNVNRSKESSREKYWSPWGSTCVDSPTEDCEVINIIDDTPIRRRSSQNSYKCTQTLSLNIDSLREEMKEKANRKRNRADAVVENKFRAKIDPSKNSEAESELSRVISKTMFQEMIVVGQFNLGFIIVKFDKDLFIIDQHATDEKYNFETLQKSTIIKSQKLAVPQNLHLTKINQCILKDHLRVFHKNGFEFSIQEDSILLTSVPMSRSTTFGSDDIDELLFMLQNTNSPDLARPSRIRNMFASRACRKSVMIGRALSWSEMTTLVRHMGTIEQPWNCPHGRPTMRHLINLSLVVHTDANDNC